MVEQAKQELRGWWTQLSIEQKAWRALFVACSFVVALAAKLQGWTEVPGRLTQVEADNARQDGEIGRLLRGEARAEYLFCVDLADRGLITKTPQDCYQDYSLRGPNP